ncbi:MAG TPA: AAA family ATPase, partial [Actinomycetes bacterium]|nr:AAA family ATPase [Actinomycetes bacterium]
MTESSTGTATDPPDHAPPDAASGSQAEAARQALIKLRAEVGKAVVGQDAAVTGLVIAALCRGHVLLEGVPGVAKTLLMRTFARGLALDGKRVQFTPDLMPGDVTGSLVYDSSTAKFSFREGPVFTNLLLADEINRTPPKTQAALLEAMEERQVTVDGRPRPLPEPFLVIATQNPVEYEGTYPLPEAQLDRFLFKLVVAYPSAEQEREVLARHDAGMDPHDLAATGVRAVASSAVAPRGETPSWTAGDCRVARQMSTTYPITSAATVTVRQAARPASRSSRLATGRTPAAARSRG